MTDFTYLQDRGGRIHVWGGSSPSERDPWLRAICGDPGDFHSLIKHNGAVTCQSCRKKLGMLTQIPLFKQ